MHSLRPRGALIGLIATGLLIAACSSTSTSGDSTTTTPGATSTSTGAYGTLPVASTSKVVGGTITYPIQAGAQPTYISPLVPDAQLTVYNAMFYNLLFRPMYWTPVGNRPVINTDLSLASLPVYSNQDKTVTITMKSNYKWADGHPVSAQDVVFFIDEVRAALKENASNFGNYTPGDFPDNVVSATATSPETVVLHLNRSYNPSWFTDTQLINVYPIPSTTWAKASANGPILDYTNPANARKIYDFLAGQAKDVSTYASNPLWKDVDGPFKLTSFNPTTSSNTMVPNPSYGGPQKAEFSTLKAQYFASTTAEFNALRSGALNQGVIQPQDLPQVNQIKAEGYNVYGYPDLGFEYIVFNFADKADHWDKVMAQLYIRQALAHLVDQPAIIHGVYEGAAAAAYGPTPAVPATAYVPADASANPYPYSIAAASQLLTSHGWKVVPGGTTTCQDPGTAADQCGAGIPQGQNLNFTDYYTNDPPSIQQENSQLASAAHQVGIKVNIIAKTFNYIVNQYDDPVARQNNNKWQVEDYGGFTTNDDPTTDTIFNTGGNNNEGDYSSATADRLIKASKYSDNPNAVRDEASYLTKDLPALFLPNPDVIAAWKGISGPPDSFANLSQYAFTPEYWYRTTK